MKTVHLNRRLVLEEMTEGSDGAGGLIQNWQAIGTLWAEVAAGTGRDVGVEEVVLARVGYRITVRAAAVGSDRRPRAGQRFREGPRIYSIVAVAERDQGGRFVTCHCREEEPR